MPIVFIAKGGGGSSVYSGYPPKMDTTFYFLFVLFSLGACSHFETMNEVEYEDLADLLVEGSSLIVNSVLSVSVKTTKTTTPSYNTNTTTTSSTTTTPIPLANEMRPEEPANSTEDSFPEPDIKTTGFGFKFPGITLNVLFNIFSFLYLGQV